MQGREIKGGGRATGRSAGGREKALASSPMWSFVRLGQSTRIDLHTFIANGGEIVAAIYSGDPQKYEPGLSLHSTLTAQ